MGGKFDKFILSSSWKRGENFVQNYFKLEKYSTLWINFDPSFPSLKIFLQNKNQKLNIEKYLKYD